MGVYHFYPRSKHLLCGIFIVLFVCFSEWQVFSQQQRTVRGRIVDKEGEPLPGASIWVKETTIGTVTDVEGNYLINLTNTSNPILVASFMGYNQSEIIVGNQTVIDFTLTESSESLEEVVVIAYGSQSKASVTGAISSISGEKLKLPTAQLSTDRKSTRLNSSH